MSTPDDILRFWFHDHKDQWFSASPAFDEEVIARFGDDLSRAARGEYEGWAGQPRSRLALIILLDQFSRQAHRGRSAAFAQDALALDLTRSGITLGHDAGLSDIEKAFFYMPLMHAEDDAAQAESLRLFSTLGADQKKFAQIHYDVIKRFGRFPRRNAALGRKTTGEEQTYLDGGGQF